jgi:hypothetical protein
MRGRNLYELNACTDTLSASMLAGGESVMTNPPRFGDGAEAGLIESLRVLRCPTKDYAEVPYDDGVTFRLWRKADFERLPPHLRPDDAEEVPEMGVYVVRMDRV